MFQKKPSHIFYHVKLTFQLYYSSRVVLMQHSTFSHMKLVLIGIASVMFYKEQT